MGGPKSWLVSTATRMPMLCKAMPDLLGIAYRDEVLRVLENEHAKTSDANPASTYCGRYEERNGG
jgi:putative hemolysin